MSLLLALTITLTSVGASFCGDDGASDAVFFDHPVLVSPQAGEQHAPLNVELLLGGLVDRLDLDAPTWRLRLVGAGGDRVPLQREGARAWPTAPLTPDTEYTLWIEPTDAHGCPDCVTPSVTTFRTTTEAFTEPPHAAAVSGLAVFEGDLGCGGPRLFVDLDLPPRAARVEVALQRPGDQPRRAVQAHVSTDVSPHAFTAERVVDSMPFAIGEPLVVAITLFDLAGNASDALLRRTRVLSTGARTDRTCPLPLTPRVRSAAALPANADLVIDFPFAPQPVVLVRDSGEQIALDRVGGERNTALLRPARELIGGERLTLTAAPCERCVCSGCGRFSPVEVVVAGADHTPPDPPRLIGIVRDTAPPAADDDACALDGPAIVLHLDVPDDDVIGYRGVMRAGGLPGVVLAGWANGVDDGDVREIRFDARDLTNEVAQTFALYVTAIDAAGNGRTAAITAPAPSAPSCAATHAPTGAPTGLAGLVVLALALGRRRR